MSFLAKSSLRSPQLHEPLEHAAPQRVSAKDALALVETCRSQVAESPALRTAAEEHVRADYPGLWTFFERHHTELFSPHAAAPALDESNPGWRSKK